MREIKPTLKKLALLLALAIVAIEPELIAQELMYLRANFGVYVVLGNHDWWYNAARVKASLEMSGSRFWKMTLLR